MEKSGRMFWGLHVSLPPQGWALSKSLVFTQICHLQMLNRQMVGWSAAGVSR